MVAEYFVSEVLDRQPAEVVQFMLATSILDELTVEACAAVTECCPRRRQLPPHAGPR